MSQRWLTGAAACLIGLIVGSAALNGQAIRNVPGFATNSLARNDDESTGLVDLGFTVNFFGLTRTQTYVNNNGNITFDDALSTFTPFPLSGTSRQIIAPFFSDVDTRAPSPGLTQYGQGLVDGRAAFGVDWFNVGYFSEKADKLNAFQLILINRDDTGAGNFDFEFNYGMVQWESGGASGDNNPNDGLCEPSEPACVSARVGWSNGNIASFELPGSDVHGAFLDGGPNALTAHSLNANVLGRYVFQVRSGQVVPPTVSAVPEPATTALVGSGLLGVLAVARRRRAARGR
jgi:hypothetical protein